MSFPRKRKKELSVDATGIDFSVITSALKTGGKMIEQIMRGIQYGSPETRLLMTEECDFIMECRVCRALFRALPNFIAHKRVYCCVPHCEFDTAFQATMSAVQQPEQPVVVVTPEAPASGSSGNRFDVADAKPSKGDACCLAPGCHECDMGSVSAEARCGEGFVEDLQCGTRTAKERLSGWPALADTVDRIERGELGQSEEYAALTAAAEKSSCDGRPVGSCAALKLSHIPNCDTAVYMNREFGTKQPGETIVVVTSSGAVSMTKDELDRLRSPISDGGGVNSQEHRQPLTFSRLSDVLDVKNAGRKASVGEKKTVVKGVKLERVSRVVTELRQRKGKQKLGHTKSKLPSAQELNRGDSCPGITASAMIERNAAFSQSDDVPILGGHKTAISSRFHNGRGDDGASNRSNDSGSSVSREATPGTEDSGKLCAVVKRRRAVRPGTLTWLDAAADSVGEIERADGCGSNIDGGASGKAFMCGGGVEVMGDSTMDLENLTCTACKVTFQTKKTLRYHCQSHHTGRRTLYPCPYCLKVFYYFWGLTRHLNTSHRKYPSDIERMRQHLRRQAYKQSPCASHAGCSSRKAGGCDHKTNELIPFSSSHHSVEVAVSRNSVCMPALKSTAGQGIVLSIRNILMGKSLAGRQMASMGNRRLKNNISECSLFLTSRGKKCHSRKLVARSLQHKRMRHFLNQPSADSSRRLSEDHNWASEFSVRLDEKSDTFAPVADSKDHLTGSSLHDINTEQSDYCLTGWSEDCNANNDHASGSTFLKSYEFKEVGSSMSTTAPEIIDDTLLSAASSFYCAGSDGSPISHYEDDRNGLFTLSPSESEITVCGADSSHSLIDDGEKWHDSMATNNCMSSALSYSGSTGAHGNNALSTSTLGEPLSFSAQFCGQSLLKVHGEGSSLELDSSCSASCSLSICSHCQWPFSQKNSLTSHLGDCHKHRLQPSPACTTDQTTNSLISVTDGGNCHNTPNGNAAAPLSDSHSQHEGCGLVEANNGGDGTAPVSVRSHVAACSGHWHSLHSQCCCFGDGAVSPVSSISPQTVSATAPVIECSTVISGGELGVHLSGNGIAVTTVARSFYLDSLYSVTVNTASLCNSTSAKTATVSKPSPPLCSLDDSVDLLRLPDQECMDRRLALQAVDDGTGEGNRLDLCDDVASQTAHQTESKNSPGECTVDAMLTQKLDHRVKDAHFDKSIMMHCPIAGLPVQAFRDLPKTDMSDDEVTISGSSVPVALKLDVVVSSTRSCDVVQSACCGISSSTISTCWSSASRPSCQSSPLNKTVLRLLSTSTITHTLSNRFVVVDHSLSRSEFLVPTTGVAAGTKRRIVSVRSASRTQSSLRIDDVSGVFVVSPLSINHVKNLKKVIIPSLYSKANKNLTSISKSFSVQVSSSGSVGALANLSHLSLLPMSNSASLVQSQAKLVCSVHPPVMGSLEHSREGNFASSIDIFPSQQNTSESMIADHTSLAIDKRSRSPVMNSRTSVYENVSLKRSDHTGAPHSSDNSDFDQDSLLHELDYLTPVHKSPALLLSEHQPSLSDSENVNSISQLQSTASVLTDESHLHEYSDVVVTCSVFLHSNSDTNEANSKPLSFSNQQAHDPSLEYSDDLEMHESIGRERSTARFAPITLPKTSVALIADIDRIGESQQPASESEDSPSKVSVTNERPHRERRFPLKMVDSIYYPEDMNREGLHRSLYYKRHAGNKVSFVPDPKAVGAAPPVTNTGPPTGQGVSSLTTGPDTKVTMSCSKHIDSGCALRRRVDPVNMNKSYVSDPACAGKLTCQDSRKVVELVNESRLRCLKCQKLFTTVSNLRRHAIRHLGWRRFKCRLCRFCCYDRSECSTHIVRTHRDRLHSDCSTSFIDSFITDLNREASFIQSFKRRHALDSLCNLDSDKPDPSIVTSGDSIVNDHSIGGFALGSNLCTAHRQGSSRRKAFKVQRLLKT